MSLNRPQVATSIFQDCTKALTWKASKQMRANQFLKQSQNQWLYHLGFSFSVPFWNVSKSPSPFQLWRWVLSQMGPLLNVQLLSYCKLLRGALRDRHTHTHTSISRAANLACWALSSCLSLWLPPLQGEASFRGREGGRNRMRSKSGGGITATYKHKHSSFGGRWTLCGKHPFQKRTKRIYLSMSSRLLYWQCLKSFQWFYNIH